MNSHSALRIELMVPRTLGVGRRINGFYRNIGWIVQKDSNEEHLTRVMPLSEGPTISYWQTENPSKLERFVEKTGESKSGYNCGLKLAALSDLVEVTLIVPNDESVLTIYERGGALLADHTHVGPREHFGAQEFRFADPFNYSLRVTADPGYQPN